MKRLIITMLLSVFWNSLPLAQTPDEVLVAVDKIRAPGDDFGFSLHVVYERNGVSESEFDFRVRVKDAVKSLVTYESPSSSKGKRLLVVERSMWIYEPRTRRSIRISPKEQLLGQTSVAIYSDVVYSINYSVESIADGMLDGQDVLNLRLVPRGQPDPYQHIELTVAKHDSRPLQAKFFAPSGSLLKTILYRDYQMVLDAQRPMRLEVLDAIDISKRIVMRYRDLQLTQTPDLYFQKDYLPHLQ